MILVSFFSPLFCWRLLLSGHVPGRKGVLSYSKSVNDSLLLNFFRLCTLNRSRSIFDTAWAILYIHLKLNDYYHQSASLRSGVHRYDLWRKVLTELLFKKGRKTVISHSALYHELSYRYTSDGVYSKWYSLRKKYLELVKLFAVFSWANRKISNAEQSDLGR